MKSVFSSRALRRLAAGVAVVSAVSAGTAAASPEFGPQHGYNLNLSGGNWGGYVGLGSFATATASWTEPAVTCKSTKDLFAAWVGIDGDTSSTVEQAGVATDCSGHSPVYQAWYEMYPAAPVYYSNPVSAGDRITATVIRTGTNTYRLDISDSTEGWTKWVTKSLASKHSSAEAVIESPTDSYPNIPGGMRFTHVKFNDAKLSTLTPAGVAADDRGIATYRPSAIGSDGDSFSVTRIST
jgi:hypothetical protein